MALIHKKMVGQNLLLLIIEELTKYLDEIEEIETYRVVLNFILSIIIPDSVLSEE